jgi:hypothetical protein
MLKTPSMLVAFWSASRTRVTVVAGTLIGIAVGVPGVNPPQYLLAQSHLPPVVTIQLMPPINEDNPENTDVTGVQIALSNPGPKRIADYSPILQLPPIKSAAIPKQHRNGLTIVAGNKEGSTFLHFEALELRVGEPH